MLDKSIRAPFRQFYQIPIQNISETFPIVLRVMFIIWISCLLFIVKILTVFKSFLFVCLLIASLLLWYIFLDTDFRGTIDNRSWYRHLWSGFILIEILEFRLTKNQFLLFYEILFEFPLLICKLVSRLDHSSTLFWILSL